MKEAKSIRELEEFLGAEKIAKERLELAHLFKFLVQDYNPSVTRKLPYEDVKFKTYHGSHAKAFAKLHFIFHKYKIDPRRFISYTMREDGTYAPEPMLNPLCFRRYAAYLYRVGQYRRICKLFAKSVNFVASECIKLNVGPAEYLRSLVVNNRLGYEYISGRISKYFLAAIQNFREMYEHLDQINRDELRIIYDTADELRNALDESLIAIVGERLRPIGAVEAAMKKVN